MIISVPTDAWGRMLVYGSDLQQWIGLEAAMIAIERIEYRSQLAHETKAKWPSFQLCTWDSNDVTYDFE